jgi:hypothetical protein
MDGRSQHYNPTLMSILGLKLIAADCCCSWLAAAFFALLQHPAGGQFLASKAVLAPFLPNSGLSKLHAKKLAQKRVAAASAAVLLRYGCCFTATISAVQLHCYYFCCCFCNATAIQQKYSSSSNPFLCCTSAAVFLLLLYFCCIAVALMLLLLLLLLYCLC